MYSGIKNMTFEELRDKFDIVVENLDHFFFIVMGILITFMQIGFGILESGAVHKKNSLHVMFKNMMDMMLCGVAWWLVGYTLAFGTGNPFLGIYQYQGGRDFTEKKQFSHFFFQISYASTSATVVSGAVVGRINLVAYLTYSFLISAVVYPIVCHWVWTPEGWLYLLGFKDYAGSAVVHMVGGACAIVAAIILGPRKGRFPPKDYVRTRREEMLYEHSNGVITGLGGMLLYSGWMAFNGGGVLHITQAGDGETVSRIMVNTWISGAASILTNLVLFRSGLGDGNKRWSMLNSIYAGMAGMAGACAHSESMEIWAAFVGGVFIGITYCLLMKVTRFFKIDDPLDVIPIHFGGGVCGTVVNSLFRFDSLFGGYPVYAGWLLAYQIAGVLAIMAWCWGCALVIFGGLRLLGILRMTEEEEELGADLAEHREHAYCGINCEYQYLSKKHDSPDSIPDNTTDLDPYPYTEQGKRISEGTLGYPTYIQPTSGLQTYGNIPRIRSRPSQTSLPPDQDIGIEVQRGLGQRHFSNVAL